MNSMFVNKLVKRKLNTTKRIQIFSLSGSQFLWEITPRDKANAMKVLREITTQHGQLIFHEIFTKVNTMPNEHHGDTKQC